MTTGCPSPQGIRGNGGLSAQRWGRFDERLLAQLRRENVCSGTNYVGRTSSRIAEKGRIFACDVGMGSDYPNRPIDIDAGRYKNNLAAVRGCR
jgi:hypothetical protein